MPYSLGTVTVNKGFLLTESHKLHQSFEVATGQTIYKASPVVLDATGKVELAGALEAKANVIGFAVFGALAGEEVTVVMKAASVAFYGSADTFTPANLIAYSGYNGTTEYNEAVTAGALATNQIGWALDVAATIGDVVRVALY